jgi:hypothetical protein
MALLDSSVVEYRYDRDLTNSISIYLSIYLLNCVFITIFIIIISNNNIIISIISYPSIIIYLADIKLKLTCANSIAAMMMIMMYYSDEYIKLFKMLQ